MTTRVNTHARSADGEGGSRLSILTGPALVFPEDHPTTLVEVLQQAALSPGNLIFVNDKGEEHHLPYRELRQRALQALAALQLLGAKPGRAVILQLDELDEFLVSFWACILGGLVPVPVLPFRNADANDSSFRKLQKIAAQLDSPVILMGDRNAESVRRVNLAGSETAGSLLLNGRITTFGDIGNCETEGVVHTVQPNDQAFLQFTSGSTSFPKGVCITHKNVLATIQGMSTALGVTESSCLLNWMPFFHDMGLIAGHLMAVVSKCNVVSMKPFTFVRRPLFWLTKIHEHRVTVTFSPNFGLKRILEKAAPEQLKRLDLSCLEVLLNGAEPISMQTCDSFLDLLNEHCGLRKDCMLAGYGLAEASLAVTIAPLGQLMRKHVVNRDVLGHGQRVEYVTAADPKASVFADEGPAVAGMQLRIVDDSDQVLPAGSLGNVQIRGASVTQGYFMNREADEQSFCDGWFRTGDLGFIHDGRFVITGRVKDVVFVNGQNYYSHDFEHACEDILGLDRLVVSGHYDDERDEEIIVAFVACNKQFTGAREKTEILRRVQMRINQGFDVTPAVFVLLKSAGEIPKTTSGKIIRHKLLAHYNEGKFSNQCIELAELLEIAPDLNRDPDSGKHVTIAELKLLIRHLWSDVLNISQQAIGDHDPFFSLGGTSIKAVEVLALAEETIDCPVTQEMFREHDTIHGLANHIARENVGVRCKFNSLDRIASDSERQQESPEDILATAANASSYSLEEAIHENDIAITGMGCVFPQAGNVEEFWQLLMEGRDCITEFPNDRGNIHEFFEKDSDTLNKTVSKWGSFVESHHFDPGFFNMSEDEAITMDPHQRIFLNAAVQAIQDSGLVNVEGSNMGVFVGASGAAFYQHQQEALLTPSLLTGSLANLAAARVSHVFNLKGPSLSVDTACSSSLASVDLACKSILNGESDVALAGGVQVMEGLIFYLLFSRAGILSPQGKCFTFSDKANGFVPGEGAGAVVLKRYRQAIADGDRVYAVIKATAMNNDGSSLGIMAPNPEGQENVIRTALSQAGVNPQDIGYVEAHGTGTDIGDLIEVRSLSLAFNEAQAVPKQSCAIGSVKTNMGHQLSAAGISGLMKAALAVYHGKIPATLNCENERKALKLAETPFFVCHQPLPWPKTGPDSQRLAAVNSFGFGGTNVHAILSSAYHEDVHHQLPAVADEPQVFCLSARSEASLARASSAFESFARQCPEATPARDVAYTYGALRRHYRENRVAIVARSLDDAATLVRGDKVDGARLFENRCLPKMRRRIAWLFSGQGSQHPGMGAALFRNEPVFRDVINKCDEIAQPLLGVSLRDLLVSSRTQQQVSSTAITQPLVFAMDYALAQLWQSWGVKPDFMLGHSIGEYVAACASGLFTLEDALATVIRRGALMGALPEGGGMTAVLLAPDELGKQIEALGLPLDISAYNSPMSTVVSGELAALDELHKRLDEKAVACTPLAVSHAFHSRHMESVLDEFRQFIAGVRMSTPTIPVISNVSGKLYQGHECSPEYWAKHIRNPVRFQAGVQSLVATGAGVFLEIGAQAHLAGLVRRIIKGGDALILSSLSKHDPQSGEDRQPVLAKAGLYANGVDIDWGSYYAAHGERRWQNSKPPAGIERRDGVKGRVAGGRLVSVPAYPLERRSMFRAVGNQDYPFRHMFRQIDADRYEYVPDPDSVLFRDHVINKLPILSGAGQCDLICHLHMQSFSHAPKCLRNISFHQPWLGKSAMTVSFSGDREKSFLVENARGGTVFKGFSSTYTHSEIPPDVCLQEIQQRLPLTFTQDTVYETFSDCGINYGPFHRNIIEMRASKTEALAHIRDATGDSPHHTHGYFLHPGILDSAFQASAGLLMAQLVDADGNISTELPLMVPLGVESICIFKFIQDGEFFSHATLVEGSLSDVDSDLISCNIRLYDAAGTTCVAINKMQMKRMPGFRTASDKKTVHKTAVVTSSRPHEISEQDRHAETAEFFHTVWKEQALIPTAVTAGPSRWLVFGSVAACEQQLAPTLAEQGIDLALVPWRCYQSADVAAMTAILEKAGDVSGLVFLGDYEVPATADVAADIDTMRSLFHLLRAVSALSRTNKAWKRIRFIRATRNACPSDEADSQFDVRKTATTGFLRSARIEFPLMDIRQLDFGNTAEAQLAACLGAELLSPESAADDGPETRYHNGKRYRLMVEPVTVNHVRERKDVFNQDKVFWIIGGTSGVGQELALHLARNYQADLVLSGSRRLPEPAEYDRYVADNDDPIAATINSIRKLESLGSKVSYVSTDVRSPDSIRVSRETIHRLHGGIDGIFFGALQLDDRMIVQKAWPDYRNMMDMRVHGVRELIRQTAADEPDFIVLFSSLSGVTGNIGQSDYSASTVYMDALPLVQPADSKCRFYSIQWGPWALGQQVSDIVLDHLQRSGFLHVTPQLGMEALEKLVLGDCRCAAFVPGSENASRIAVNINNLRQGLGSRSGRKKTAKPRRVEEQFMSNSNPEVNVAVSGSQLQMLMSEFEKQRDMLLKLCETQNALLTSAVGGMATAVIPPTVTASRPVAVPVPEPVAPVAAPPPLAETVPVAAAPVVDDAAVAVSPTVAPVAPEPAPAAVAEATPEPAAAAGQDAPADLFEYVRALMAKAIEIPESDIDPDQNIMELGADSMTAMSMVKEVETRYNIELPATLLFEYSTLNELVDFLREEVGDDSAQQA